MLFYTYKYSKRREDGIKTTGVKGDSFEQQVEVGGLRDRKKSQTKKGKGTDIGEKRDPKRLRPLFALIVTMMALAVLYCQFVANFCLFDIYFYYL